MNIRAVFRAAGARRSGDRSCLCAWAGALRLVLASLVFLLLCCHSAAARSPRFVPGRILVKPRPHLSEAEFAARLRVHAASHRHTLHPGSVRVLTVSENRAEALLASLRADPAIEFVERDYLAQAAFLPNDPYLLSGQEWHLAKIQAPEAWNLSPGSPDTLVAILDSGINAAHPDLAGRVLPGFNFLANDTNVADDFGHGTAVAGVVVAAGNNGLGVAGVAYGCRVLPVKVVDSSGFAAYSAIAQGIYYAVDQGARVINISIAGSAASTTLQQAINYAWDNNVLIVAAAGNDASSTLQYPAACDHVLAVAATEPDDTLAPFSSFGPWVALAAPGDNIWTTQRDLANPYGSWRGTSFASPLVAGAAALAASANPALSQVQILALLQQTADDPAPAVSAISFPYRRLNIFRVLSAANPAASPAPPAVALSSPTSAALFPLGASVPLVAVVSPAASCTVTSLLFIAEGRVVTTCSTPPFVATWLPPLPGTFSLSAVAADDQGLASTSAPVRITISAPPTFVPNPFPVARAAYAGLVANTNALTPETSAFFRLTVTRKGKFSGRLLNAGRGYGFRGQFDLAGNAAVTLNRSDLGPLTLAFHLDLTNATDQLAGSLSDGAWTSPLTANRNVFSSRFNPALQAGLHPFILLPGENAAPVAAGFSRISRAGAAKLRGKLHDSRPFATASALARNGDCPFYLSLNHGTELIIGWLNFPAGGGPDATGTVLWVNTGLNPFAAPLQARLNR